MNVHKPRDRSHYERFEAYHATFYRSVEASSVTPFSPRALDRGIAEVAVALARHGHPELTKSESAVRAKDERPKLLDVVNVFGQRVESHAVMSKEKSDERRGRVHAKVEDLLDDWAKIARAKHDKGGSLRYQAYEDGTGPYLLRNPLDPDLERVEGIERQFKAHRSLRCGAVHQPLDETAEWHRDRRRAGRLVPRPQGQIRQSQMITMFGPGALVDLPRHAEIVGGLDMWRWGDDDRRREIQEPRPVAKIQQALGLEGLKLYEPPTDNLEADVPPSGVTAYEFPEWFVA